MLIIKRGTWTSIVTAIERLSLGLVIRENNELNNRKPFQAVVFGNIKVLQLEVKYYHLKVESPPRMWG